MDERLVINFHGIGEPGPDIPADEVPYWCPAGEWLGFADALAEAHSAGRVQLEITFDDGNLSDVDHALPALVDRGLTATFFVCAGRLGQVGYLGPAHLRELRAAGMGIGSHGWGHVDLRSTTDDELRREASDARERLAEASVGEIDRFAIPFGSYDRRVLRSLRDYRHVHSSDGGFATPGWFVPRASYVRGWSDRSVRDMVERRTSLLTFLGQRGKRLIKSLR